MELRATVETLWSFDHTDQEVGPADLGIGWAATISEWQPVDLE